jgi:hypothetical protein
MNAIVPVGPDSGKHHAGEPDHRRDVRRCEDVTMENSLVQAPKLQGPT